MRKSAQTGSSSSAAVFAGLRIEEYEGRGGFRLRRFTAQGGEVHQADAIVRRDGRVSEQVAGAQRDCSATNGSFIKISA